MNNRNKRDVLLHPPRAPQNANCYATHSFESTVSSDSFCFITKFGDACSQVPYLSAGRHPVRRYSSSYVLYLRLATGAARTEICFAVSIGGTSPSPMIPQLLTFVNSSPRGVASCFHRFIYGNFGDYLSYCSVGHHPIRRYNFS